MKRTKLMILAVVTALATLAVAPAASAGGHQEGTGLVVVQISDTNVNVTVPINAAVGIAANVCNIDLTVAVLAEILETGDFEGTCDSRSRAFADQDLTITNTN